MRNHAQKTGILIVALTLFLAGLAQADVITLSLSDFLVFSDAGTETAGASLFYGNVGSNANFTLGASDTHILGSVYAGGNVSLAQNTAIGSDGTKSHIDLESPILGAAPPPPVDGAGFPTFPLQLERVVANGTASVGNDTTKIFGDLDAGTYTDDWTISGYTRTTSTIPAADTFATITMPGTSFTHAGGTNVVVAGGGTTTITPGHYGDLTSSPGDPTILIQSGDYYFDSIDTSGKKVTLKIDLTSGNIINIYTVNDMDFGGQNNELMVKGAGTGGEYVLIREAPELAALINWETRGRFNLGGGTGNEGGWGSIWGGTLYSTWDSTGDGITIGQHVDYFGALWAIDTIDLADHSRYTNVALVPTPSAILLAIIGLGLTGNRLKKKKLL